MSDFLKDLQGMTNKEKMSVIALKVCYMDEKLDDIDKKVDSLISWKIKVGAYAAGIGSIVSAIIFKLPDIIRLLSRI